MKQLRLLANMLELYTLNNKHTDFQETELLSQQSSSRNQSNEEFHFEVCLLSFVHQMTFLKLGKTQQNFNFTINLCFYLKHKHVTP